MEFIIYALMCLSAFGFAYSTIDLIDTIAKYRKQEKKRKQDEFIKHLDEQVKDNIDRFERKFDIKYGFKLDRLK